ncbi:MAG: ACT domain-containing protein [Ktedonobacterales bacterium]
MPIIRCNYQQHWQFISSLPTPPLLISLADAGISLFALATFDTDYILIHAADLECVRAALAEAGHTVTD